jgi:hypothetical protein
MGPIRVYSSQPVGAKLACAFLALGSVVELPLSQLPPPASPPRRRCTQADDLERVSQRLVEIGDQLNDHENGKCRLDAGLEQGLRFEREGLRNRQRGLVASVQAQKGRGVASG